MSCHYVKQPSSWRRQSNITWRNQDVCFLDDKSHDQLTFIRVRSQLLKKALTKESQCQSVIYIELVDILWKACIAPIRLSLA